MIVLGIIIFIAAVYYFTYSFISISSKWQEDCYKEMESKGVAVFGMCGGQMGGDKYTDYLSYQCVDCKYFVNCKNEKEKK